MDNITTRPELNITRSNRHILNGVTNENFDKFYELVVSHLSKYDLKTFHIIIEGKLKFLRCSISETMKLCERLLTTYCKTNP